MGLSRFLALILRHKADEFGLVLDPRGWAPLERVLDVVRAEHRFRDVRPDDVQDLVAGGSGDGSRRFELADGRIRARYGHSLARRIEYPPAVPPQHLFHGTAPDTLAQIRRAGLRPMGRQYVHLSATRAMARRVGARHGGRPVVVGVRAAEAHAAGTVFHDAGNGVWLTPDVARDYLDVP
ncbi:MAG: RNA 2'-phosphotransferase [Acidobacteria bacterium]|nr:RNA 2'-phosphotransferase [Acidobacteriota bacterium]